MSLEQKLQQKLNELEDRKKQEAEIREQIAKLQVKKAELQQLHAKLQENYPKVEEELQNFQEPKKKLHEIYYQYKDTVFAAEGIKSKKELLANEEYSGEQEVKKYSDQKDKVHANIVTLGGVKEQIKNFDAAIPVGRKEKLLATMEQRLQELNDEVVALRSQIPEGQEQNAIDVKYQVRARHEKANEKNISLFRDYPGTKSIIDSLEEDRITPADLQDAQTIGDETVVKDVIGEADMKMVETYLTGKYPDYVAMKKDLQELRGFQEQFTSLENQSVKQLERLQRILFEQIMKVLDDNKNSEVWLNVKAYYGADSSIAGAKDNSARNLIKDLVEHNFKTVYEYYYGDGGEFKAARIQGKQFISGHITLAENLNKLLTVKKLDQIEQETKAAILFLNEVSNQIARDPSQLMPNRSQLNYFTELIPKKHEGQEEKVEPYIKLSKTTAAALSRVYGVDQVKEITTQVNEQDHRVKEEQETLSNIVKMHVELSWLWTQLNELKKSNSESQKIIHMGEELEKSKLQAEKILLAYRDKIANAKETYRPELFKDRELIKIGVGNRENPVGWDKEPIKEVEKETEMKMKKIEDEIKMMKTKISVIDKQLKSRLKFRSTKEELRQSKTEYLKELASLQNDRIQLDNSEREQNSLAGKLRNLILDILNSCQQFQLNQVVQDVQWKVLPLTEMFKKIESRLQEITKQTLPEGEQQFYAKFQQLSQQWEIKLNRYKYSSEQYQERYRRK